MRTALLILLSIFAYGNLLGNEPPQQVFGRVSDEQGEFLPYANIIIKNTTIGTSTDMDGKYTLPVLKSGKYTIVVKYTGYIPVEKQIYLSKDTTINFCLKEDALNLNEVTVTGTRTPKMLKDAPLITRVINTEQIKRINAVTVKDLLEVELPGLEFTRQMDGQTAINMQGMSGEYILFLVDGERMAGETLNNIDYNRLNTENIERIEIVRGASSALYGSNAIGGVVNIIRKDASKPWSVNVNAYYGSQNEQRYNATVGVKQNKISSLTSFSYKRKDTYVLKDTTTDVTPVNGGWDFNINEKFTWKLNDKISITGKGGIFNRYVDNYGQNVKIKDFYTNYNGNVRMNYMISDKQSLDVSYLFDRYNKYDRYVRLDADSLNYRNTQHTARAQYNYSFKKGNTLTGGVEFFRDGLMSYQFSGKTYNINDYIAYAQHDYNFTDNFNIVYGARMDYYSSFGAHVSPNVSLMYKLSPFTFRTSYSRGFRAPSLKEMHTEWDMGNLGWFIIKGNPDLKPEISDNFMLSTEYSRDRVNFSVIGYFNNITDKIATIYNARKDTAHYTNVNKSKLAGLDANLAIKLPYGFTLKTAYAYVYENLKVNNVNVSSTRPHSATLGLNYEFEHKNYHLNVALNGRFMGKLDTNQENSDNTFTEIHYPGYQMWKLVVTQHLFKAYTLQATVDNLFNYKPKLNTGNTPISPGTTFMIGLSVNIDEIF